MLERLIEQFNFAGKFLQSLPGAALEIATRAFRDLVEPKAREVLDAAWRALPEPIRAVLESMASGAGAVAGFVGNTVGFVIEHNPVRWGLDRLGGLKDRLTGAPDPAEQAAAGLRCAEAAQTCDPGIVQNVSAVVGAVTGGVWDFLFFPVLNRVLQNSGAYFVLGIIALLIILNYFAKSLRNPPRWMPGPGGAAAGFGVIHLAMTVFAFLAAAALLTQSLFIYPTEDAVSEQGGPGRFAPALGNFRLVSSYGWQRGSGGALTGSFEEGIRFGGPSFALGKSVIASAAGRVVSVDWDDPRDPNAGLGLTVIVDNAFLGPGVGGSSDATVRFKYGGLAPFLWNGVVSTTGDGSPGEVRLALARIEDGARVGEPTFVHPHYPGAPAAPGLGGNFAVMVPRAGHYALAVVPPQGAISCGAREFTGEVSAERALPKVEARVAFPRKIEVEQKLEDGTVVLRADGTPVKRIVTLPPDCGLFGAQAPLVAGAYGAPVLQATPSPGASPRPSARPSASAASRPTAAPVRTLPHMIWPVPPGAAVSQEFGDLSSYAITGEKHQREGHTGIDIAVNFGTPVVAAADGILHRFNGDLLAGRMIFIDHPKLGLQTRYAHLKEYDPRIPDGGEVKQGQLIAASGSAGTGAHLHFEVVRLSDGRYVNPRDYATGGADASIENPAKETALVPPDEWYVHRAEIDVRAYAVIPGTTDQSAVWTGLSIDQRTAGSCERAAGPLVLPGQGVRQGQRLAAVGCSGRRLGEPYLALQVHFVGVPFDARSLLDPDEHQAVPALTTTAVDPLSFLPMCGDFVSSQICGSRGKGEFAVLLPYYTGDAGKLSESQRASLTRNGNYAFDPGGASEGRRLLGAVFGYPRPFTEEEVRLFNTLATSKDWSPVSGAVDAAQQDAVRRYATFIREAAARYEVPASLIAAVIEQESSGRAEAVSGAGALGLMQVMPFWFAARDIQGARRLDPGVNISLGAYILRYEADMVRARQPRADVWTAVLARYHGGNCGFDLVTGKYGTCIDAAGARSDRYVPQVIQRQAKYRDLDR